MADVPNLFWDSCVFYAFLRNEHAIYDVDSIHQYLDEAREGKHRIYASSLVFAEVMPSAITKPGVGSFQDFISDLQGAVTIIDASPNVMHTAALLKDLPYKKPGAKARRLGTPDAIMLASCLELRDALGVKVDCFHTFDDGRKHGLDGKMVSLLSYQDWCDGFTSQQMTVANRVISLNRVKPAHPAPRLFHGSPKKSG